MESNKNAAYHNNPKYWGIPWANSVDPDQKQQNTASDQVLQFAILAAIA